MFIGSIIAWTEDGGRKTKNKQTKNKGENQEPGAPLGEPRNKGTKEQGNKGTKQKN
jgi:hypothetical protein